MGAIINYVLVTAISEKVSSGIPTSPRCVNWIQNRLAILLSVEDHIIINAVVVAHVARVHLLLVLQYPGLVEV